MNDSSKKCLICSTPNTSVHFGIDACRACSSFFKRAQVSGHRYPCRQGTQKCDVIRDNGSMCRGCRYDKCIAIGMVYDGPMRVHKTNSRAESLSSPDEGNGVCISISNCLSTIGSDESVCEVERQRPVGDSLLKRITREHTLCVHRHRIQERSLIRQFDLARLSHPTEEVYLASFDFAIATFNANVAETWQFLLAVFPSLKNFPYDDQREFYRLCMPSFGILDCFYRTKEIWSGFSRYTMCSALACTDMHHPDVWIGPNDGGPLRKELLETIRRFIDDQMTLLVPSFEKAGICEQEKYALLALFICESDLQSDFSERFQLFIEEIRKQILDDLHRFYTEEMGLSEYSTRLGNLLTICHTFQEGNALFQEFFRMQITVFDLYVTETMLRDLIL